MGLSRSGTLFLIGFLVLIALSLHPVASVEAVVDRAFAPSRLLAELARPFAWFERSEVTAAEAEVSASIAIVRERAHAVLFAAQRAAMPVDPTLVRGRAVVGADVIGRSPKNQDRLRLRYAVDAGITPGAPVVRGDAFVGRVIDLDPERPGECTVELLTARDFRVSAVTEGEKGPAHFVVGGILGKSKSDTRELFLATQFPSERSVTQGTVRVAEDSGSPLAQLADGFVLGELTLVDVRGTMLLGIRPPLDFAFGLNHLAILGPPEMGTAGMVLPVDPFAPESWIDARVLLAGNVSALRNTRKLSMRNASGVRTGAAVALGARFVGRIETVGVFDSDARLLSDPGLAFSALACVAGEPKPVALGRLISLGASGSNGEIRFECAKGIKIEHGAEDVTLELWTAAAEPDLPPGLWVGTARLEGSGAATILRVQPAFDAHHALRLSVWCGNPREEAP